MSVETDKRKAILRKKRIQNYEITKDEITKSDVCFSLVPTLRVGMPLSTLCVVA